MLRGIRGALCIVFGLFCLAVAAFVMIKDGFASVILTTAAFGAVSIWWGQRLIRAKSEPKDPLAHNRKQDLHLQFHLFRKHSLHTLLLMAASVIPYLLVNMAHNLPHLTREIALAYGADFAPYVARGQVWRLITGTFLHYDLVHLIGNMLALLTVGRYVDYYYGHKRLYFIYFATAIAGSLASNTMHPAIWSVGASGAVFGLYGAFIVTLFVRHPEKDKLKFSNFAMYYIFAHVVRSLAAGFGQLGIDNAAHMGGFLSGAALGYALLQWKSDWDLVRNATVATLIGVFAFMQFTIYRHVPTEAQILAREAQHQEWIGLAKRSQKFSQLMIDFQAQVQSMQQNQITLEQFQRNMVTGLKPDIELLRMDIYTFKVSTGTAYQAQLDLYNSVLYGEKMVSNLISGSREVASTQSVETYKRAVDTIKANLMAEN